MESGPRLSEWPDPGHRLSDRETDIIRRTWSRVCGDSEGLGVRVLIRFFSNSPAARQYFRQFQHLQDPQEMQHCVQLRRHARRVMGAISSLVENLEYPDEVDSILVSIGRAHALRHKVDPVYFKYAPSCTAATHQGSFDSIFQTCNLCHLEGQGQQMHGTPPPASFPPSHTPS
ncbi:cytoglobin-2-like isoform X2 [Heterodontus francisci]|uniref:cytoglobin-2-like isoform X2 n=1 Tax=Heterodontus francisci TaxID=7792 RepID=UPI00355BB17D